MFVKIQSYIDLFGFGDEHVKDNDRFNLPRWSVTVKYPPLINFRHDGGVGGVVHMS